MEWPGAAIHCECGQCSTHEYLRPKRNFLSSNDESRLLEASTRRLLCLVDCLMSAAHRKWLINVHKRTRQHQARSGVAPTQPVTSSPMNSGARKVSAGHFLSWRRCSSCTKEGVHEEDFARLSLRFKPFREVDERRVIRGELRCCWEEPLRRSRCSGEARRCATETYKEEKQQDQKSFKKRNNLLLWHCHHSRPPPHKKKKKKKIN